MWAKKNYKKTQLACYLGFVTQAICANFVPLLFITFHSDYDISFSMLALISTCFFFTQLIVDFLCAGIVDKLGYRVCIIAAEVTSGLGLAGLAFLPDLLPVSFYGILICVIIYAIGSIILWNTYMCHYICYRKWFDGGTGKSDHRGMSF
jgi:MFS family permease